MLHQVGRPLQNASDVAKQSVGLAGHSASTHSTALVLTVSLSTAWFQTYADLKTILRASCSEQEFFLNSPKIQRCPRHGKPQVDILTHNPRTWARIAGANLSALWTNSQSECDNLPYEGQVVRCEGWRWCVARA